MKSSYGLLPVVDNIIASSCFTFAWNGGRLG